MLNTRGDFAILFEDSLVRIGGNTRPTKMLQIKPDLNLWDRSESDSYTALAPSYTS